MAGHVSSLLALSEEAPFRRKFSSIFDTLLEAEFAFDQLLQALYEQRPSNSEQIAGYEVVALETTSLKDLCLMYLWRFAIEHSFRFLKQQMYLNMNQSTNPVSTDQWKWLCALAYWQLLLMWDSVENIQPTWYPSKAVLDTCKRTPGQVQRGALRFLVGLGIPALPTRTAGKGKGRTNGYRPAPRKRYSIVKKAKIAPNRVSAST